MFINSFLRCVVMCPLLMIITTMMITTTSTTNMRTPNTAVTAMNQDETDDWAGGDRELMAPILPDTTQVQGIHS